MGFFSWCFCTSGPGGVCERGDVGLYLLVNDEDWSPEWPLKWWETTLREALRCGREVSPRLPWICSFQGFNVSENPEIIHLLVGWLVGLIFILWVFLIYMKRSLPGGKVICQQFGLQGNASVLLCKDTSFLVLWRNSFGQVKGLNFVFEALKDYPRCCDSGFLTIHLSSSSDSNQSVTLAASLR